MKPRIVGDLPEADHAGSQLISVSVIIPVYNEEENVVPLCEDLLPVLRDLGRAHEVIFINDGSLDQTEARLREVAEGESVVKVINFRRNVGQTAAMMAGFDFARGEVIVPMDGDLQNDPRDIGRLLEKLDEGFDVVSGWRRDRQDSFVSRTLPSRVANWMISKVTGVHLKDYGCTLKAYRREVLSGYRLYGEMHRFVPIFARWQGGRLTEVPVQHHPRKFGHSKYGWRRVLKVLLDLMVVQFLTQYQTKPIYVFGMAGFIFILGAFAALIWAIYLKLAHEVSMIATPLPLFVLLGVITGTMCILMGLLAEVLVRIYFESQGKFNYSIKNTVNLENPDEAAERSRRG